MPYLSEMVLLSTFAATVQAFGEIVVPFPSGAPFVHAHDLIAISNRRIDFDRVTLLDLAPFPRVHAGFGGGIHFRVDVSSQVCVVLELSSCLLHCRRTDFAY